MRNVKPLFKEIECGENAVPMYTSPPSYVELYDRLDWGKAFSEVYTQRGICLEAIKHTPIGF